MITSLTRGISKIEAEEEQLVYLQCDLCKEKILVGNDFDVFEKHHRRCSKIDFIDRQAKELKGEGIDKQHFREILPLHPRLQSKHPTLLWIPLQKRRINHHYDFSSKFHWHFSDTLMRFTCDCT
jgi:hypothetical protein